MAGSQTNIRRISSFRKMPEGSFFTSGNNFFFHSKDVLFDMQRFTSVGVRFNERVVIYYPENLRWKINFNLSYTFKKEIPSLSELHFFI